jgi:hypothetical protein
MLEQLRPIGMRTRLQSKTANGSIEAIIHPLMASWIGWSILSEFRKRMLPGNSTTAADRLISPAIGGADARGVVAR